MWWFLAVGLLAAVVTACVSGLVLWGSRRLQLMPAVRERDVHRAPTPRLGGIALFAGVLVSLLFVYWVMPGAVPELTERPQQLFALLGAITIMVLVGVLDDVFDLDWMLKLGAQIIAASLLAWQGVQFLSLPVGNTLVVASPTINLILTVVLMVVVMNAVNFIDGLDGLVAGFGITANLAFFVYTRLLVTEVGIAESISFGSLIAIVLVGVCAGFLPYNWHRAKMFMGDSGALMIGLMMATSTVAVTGQLNPASLSFNVVFAGWIPMLLPIAMLALPLADLLLAVLRRLRAGKSPFAADREHLHHKLLRRGHSHLQASSIFHLWTLVVSAAALLLFVLDSVWVPMLVVTGGSIVCLIFTLVPVSRMVEWVRKS